MKLIRCNKIEIEWSQDLQNEIESAKQLYNILSPKIAELANSVPIKGIGKAGIYLKEDIGTFSLNGQIHNIKISKSGQPKITDTQLKDIFQTYFDRYVSGFKENHRRTLIHYLLDRLKGIKKRFKSKKRGSSYRASKLKRNVMRYGDAGFKFQNNKILTPSGVECKVLQNLSKVDIPKIFGGNIDIHNGRAWIYQQYEKEFNPYTPKFWIGMDINDDNSNWLVLNGTVYGQNQQIIPRTKKINDVLNEIKNKNKQISDKSIKSSIRSLFRRQWLNLQKEALKLIRKELITIISDAKSNKSGIGIDVITFETFGFGQDKIRYIFEEECIKQGVPFILTDCRYTSQTCSNCNNIDKKARISTTEYECTNHNCPEYKVKLNSHINAACNIAKQAEGSWVP